MRDERDVRPELVEAACDAGEVVTDAPGDVAGRFARAAAAPAAALRTAARERAIARLCLTLRRLARVAVAVVVARAADGRVARPSRRTAVNAISQTKAAASGGNVSPETSASTS